MKFAIVDTDPASADVLAFAARRRGHQSVALNSLNELAGNLPFEPNVIILGTDLVQGPGGGRPCPQCPA